MLKRFLRHLHAHKPHSEIRTELPAVTRTSAVGTGTDDLNSLRRLQKCQRQLVLFTSVLHQFNILAFYGHSEISIFWIGFKTFQIVYGQMNIIYSMKRICLVEPEIKFKSHKNMNCEHKKIYTYAITTPSTIYLPSFCTPKSSELQTTDRVHTFNFWDLTAIRQVPLLFILVIAQPSTIASVSASIQLFWSTWEKVQLRRL